MCDLCSFPINIKKFKHFAIIFNKYPYRFGHLLIISNRHVPSLENLTKAEKIDLINLINKTQVALKKALNVKSINIGINLGPDAGGSIPQHFHVHVIPRTPNDFNFTLFVNNLKPVMYARNIPKLKKIISEISKIKL